MRIRDLRLPLLEYTKRRFLTNKLDFAHFIQCVCLPCLSSMPGTGREGRAALKKVPGPFQVGPVDMKTLKEPSFLEASAAPKHCCLALPNKDLSPQENSEYNYVLVSLSISATWRTTS